jgi:hypothetical protein
VSVALDKDLRSCGIRVFLVGHTQLVIADDLVVRDLLELGSTAEVLGHEPWVTEDFGVGDHRDEVICRHGLPDLVQERAVVDADGWSNNLSQAFPVLEVRWSVIELAPMAGGCDV